MTSDKPQMKLQWMYTSMLQCAL